MVLPYTKVDDGTKAKPTPACRIELLVRSGELSVAVTARSTRSKVDRETDPDELALNWIPPHGTGEAGLVAGRGTAFGGAAAGLSRPPADRRERASKLHPPPGPN